MKITKTQLKQIIKEELAGVLEEEELTDSEEGELKTIKKELEGASKMHKGQADRIGKVVNEEESNLFSNIRAKKARGESPAKKGDKDYPDEKSWKKATMDEGEYHYVDAADINEEYCPKCATMEEDKKKACKPSKGKRFAKRVDGKCRSYGQAGQAKGGGDRISPGTKKGDAYCARSAGIKKCKNPPCANTLSRKKWKCKGKKSMKS